MRVRSWSLCLCLLASACGGDGGDGGDTPDANAPTTPDAAAPDAMTDATPGGGTPDAALADAAAPDAMPDAAPDAMPDAQVIDAPPDAQVYPDPWWDDAFSSRLRIDLPDPDISDFLVDVPVLVVLDPSNVAYSRLQAEGADLRFVTDDSVELAHEIEHWSPGGNSYVWVRLPSIPRDGDSRFWLYYDNPEAEDVQAPSTVWSSDYLAVWHLAEQVDQGGTVGVHHDATGNGNQGTQYRNGFVGDSTGAIGGAQSFDGQDSRISIDGAGVIDSDDTMTITVRASVQGEPNDSPHALAAGSAEDQDLAGIYWQVFWRQDNQGWAGRLRAQNPMGNPGPVNESGGLTRGDWQVITLVYNGSGFLLYVDGARIEYSSLFGTIDPFTSVLTLGDNPDIDYAERDFEGFIDEVRISGAARSANWVHVQSLSLHQQLLDYGPRECRNGSCDILP
ncbi:DUF2341 domain-containing protein [Haliangium ochraceum]|uniref:DUF2341 domain-containing protein n=1 Tax=Haliangium ochraceum (strain DSM 14365 / JCM 11303 / SMP-2) TaxID=502025 RepID=D0LH99_HALO1|nr:DUF2341 domain-containing protein [Haliangium ochraceum]ACY18244.1 Protein of unknown function DUF2341 [Haliangium ochraceum DSM 14365]